jgi:hypothetical protein
MASRRGVESWKTSLEMSRNGLKVETENAKLAVGLVVSALLLGILLLIPSVRDAVGHFVSAWAASAAAFTMLLLIVAWIDGAQKRRPKVFPFIVRNLWFVVGAVLVLSFLTALGGMNTPTTNTAP